MVVANIKMFTNGKDEAFFDFQQLGEMMMELVRKNKIPKREEFLEMAKEEIPSETKFKVLINDNDRFVNEGFYIRAYYPLLGECLLTLLLEQSEIFEVIGKERSLDQESKIDIYFRSLVTKNEMSVQAKSSPPNLKNAKVHWSEILKQEDLTGISSEYITPVFKEKEAMENHLDLSEIFNYVKFEHHKFDFTSQVYKPEQVDIMFMEIEREQHKKRGLKIEKEYKKYEPIRQTIQNQSKNASK